MPAPAPAPAPAKVWATPETTFAPVGEQPAPIVQDSPSGWFADPFAGWNFNTETMAGPPAWAAPSNLAQIAAPGLAVAGYVGPTIDAGPVGEWNTSAPTVAAPLVQWLTDAGITLGGQQATDAGPLTVQATLTDNTTGATTVAGAYTDTTSLFDLLTPILAAVGVNYLGPLLGLETAAAEAAPALLADTTAGTGFVLAEAAPITWAPAAAEAAIAAEVALWQTPALLDLLPALVAPAAAPVVAAGWALPAAEPIALPSLAVQEAAIASEVAAWQAPALADLLPTFAADAMIGTGFALPAAEPIALPSVAAQEAAIAGQVAAWQAPTVASILPSLVAPVAATVAAPSLLGTVASQVGGKLTTIGINQAIGAALSGLGLAGAADTGQGLRPVATTGTTNNNGGGLLIAAAAAFLLFR